jgi:hypothetical protein
MGPHFSSLWFNVSSLALFSLSTVPSYETEIMSRVEIPPLAKYAGQESFFGGEPPLSEGVGYLVVLGFGALFSVLTTCLVYINRYFGSKGAETSEHFK